MKRYFVNIQFNGSEFAGWQSQPNAPTVQTTIEREMSKVLQEKVGIMGCGRTDSGVHASDFVFHFDTGQIINDKLIFKLNLMLPKSIVIRSIFQVGADVHARFDAISRSYEYYIHKKKDPFNQGSSYHYPHLFTKDLSLLNSLVKYLPDYSDFYPFCKTKSDAHTTLCQVTNCEWEINKDYLIFKITANRFLRGMVRLIVGACINVTLNKLSMQSVLHSMDNKVRLEKDLSVPSQGLFLSNVQYPSTVHIKGSPSYSY